MSVARTYYIQNDKDKAAQREHEAKRKALPTGQKRQRRLGDGGLTDAQRYTNIQQKVRQAAFLQKISVPGTPNVLNFDHQVLVTTLWLLQNTSHPDIACMFKKLLAARYVDSGDTGRIVCAGRLERLRRRQTAEEKLAAWADTEFQEQVSVLTSYLDFRTTYQKGICFTACVSGCTHNCGADAVLPGVADYLLAELRWVCYRLLRQGVHSGEDLVQCKEPRSFPGEQNDPGPQGTFGCIWTCRGHQSGTLNNGGNSMFELCGSHVMFFSRTDSLDRNEEFEVKVRILSTTQAAADVLPAVDQPPDSAGCEGEGGATFEEVDAIITEVLVALNK